MDTIVVIGGGGHAKVLISVLKKSPYKPIGYTDRHNRGALLGVQHLGNDGILTGYAQAGGKLFAAIGLGMIDASDTRIRLMGDIASLGFSFPLIISPQAVVNEEVALGAGTVVFDGAVVNSGSVSGFLCILNTNSTVEHDCRLGDNVHIAPGTTVSGGVTIGDNCLIGSWIDRVAGCGHLRRLPYRRRVDGYR